MRPFTFEAVSTTRAAVQAAALGRANSATQNPAQFLAGGTTLIDLMKLDVVRPALVVDINALAGTDLGRIETTARVLRLGALVRMADAADHAEVNRNFPALAQSLKLAASQQIRNMASLGGNVLQRTRCPYFRDVSYEQCNKRSPGSGCAALDGYNRSHAILGTSDQCIASYPGDFAQALLAFDAVVDVAGPRGNRTIPFAAVHRKPGDAPKSKRHWSPVKFSRRSSSRSRPGCVARSFSKFAIANPMNVRSRRPQSRSISTMATCVIRGSRSAAWRPFPGVRLQLRQC